MGEHDGHRKRMREKFNKTPNSQISDADMLEVLLYNVQTRKDVRPLAEELLDEAGNLYQLTEKSMDELMAHKGVGLKTATLIYLLGEVARRSEEQWRWSIILNMPAKVRAYIRPRLIGCADESSFVICLDDNLRPLICHILPPEPKELLYEILSSATEMYSKIVIVVSKAHEELATFSVYNLELIKELDENLNGFGITLLDYLRINGDFYSSAAEIKILRGSTATRRKYYAPLAGIVTHLHKFKVEDAYDN